MKRNPVETKTQPLPFKICRCELCLPEKLPHIHVNRTPSGQSARTCPRAMGFPLRIIKPRTLRGMKTFRGEETTSGYTGLCAEWSDEFVRQEKEIREDNLRIYNSKQEFLYGKENEAQTAVVATDEDNRRIPSKQEILTWKENEAQTADVATDDKNALVEKELSSWCTQGKVDVEEVTKTGSSSKLENSGQAQHHPSMPNYSDYDVGRHLRRSDHYVHESGHDTQGPGGFKVVYNDDNFSDRVYLQDSDSVQISNNDSYHSKRRDTYDSSASADNIQSWRTQEELAKAALLLRGCTLLPHRMETMSGTTVLKLGLLPFLNGSTRACVDVAAVDPNKLHATKRHSVRPLGYVTCLEGTHSSSSSINQSKAKRSRVDVSTASKEQAGVGLTRRSCHRDVILAAMTRRDDILAASAEKQRAEADKNAKHLGFDTDLSRIMQHLLRTMSFHGNAKLHYTHGAVGPTNPQCDTIKQQPTAVTSEEEKVDEIADPELDQVCEAFLSAIPVVDRKHDAPDEYNPLAMLADLDADPSPEWHDGASENVDHFIDNEEIDTAI